MSNQEKKESFQIFLLTALFSMIFAGSAYYIQFILLDSIPGDKYGIFGNVIRLTRMIIGYVIPSILFVKYSDYSFKSFGIRPTSQKLVPWVAGIILYGSIGLIFIKYRIFFSSWWYSSLVPILLNLSLIAFMASITDFWTRGFVLFQINKHYNETLAIIGQNIVWFVIHIYEIDLLRVYISLGGAIAMTLFLGILGDVIALRYSDIRGLMLGHVILNVMIVLGAKGLISI